MSKEARKLALEALISYGKSPYIKQSHPKRWANGNEAIKALEEALAKQEQRSDSEHTGEPVAWINWCAATGKRSVSFKCESELASQPLYFGVTQITQKRYSNQKPLTDEEIVAINDKHYNIAYRDFDADIAIARAIEAAHGIKENT
jgi:hypothetical protein